MVSRSIQDWISAHVPYGRSLLARASSLATDARTVIKSLHPWRQLESCWPPNINIEVTNICNADCCFCAYKYQDRWRTGRGVISDEIFTMVVDAHAANGGKFIGLAPTLGEPLIDPKLIQRIRYVLDRKLEVSFFTNGILLNRIDVEALINTGIKGISVSTAPFDVIHHKRIYQTSHYDDLLLGVKKLLRARNESRADFEVGFAFRSDLSFRDTLNTKDFRKEIWPLLTEKERSRIIVTNRFDNWGGQITKGDLPKGMSLCAAPLLKRRPCKWVFVPMVAWDGQVRLCACRFGGNEARCGDDLLVGDLRAADLKSIVFSDKARDVRSRFVNGRLPLQCRNCTQYKPC